MKPHSVKHHLLHFVETSQTLRVHAEQAVIRAHIASTWTLSCDGYLSWGDTHFVCVLLYGPLTKQPPFHPCLVSKGLSQKSRAKGKKKRKGKKTSSPLRLLNGVATQISFRRTQRRATGWAIEGISVLFRWTGTFGRLSQLALPLNSSPYPPLLFIPRLSLPPANTSFCLPFLLSAIKLRPGQKLWFKTRLLFQAKRMVVFGRGPHKRADSKDPEITVPDKEGFYVHCVPIDHYLGTSQRWEESLSLNSMASPASSDPFLEQSWVGAASELWA